MKIQTVPFPPTPDETLVVCSELRPLIDGCYAATNRGKSEDDVPDSALAIFWWQALVDFIELLDGEKRVGLIGCNLHFSEAKGEKYALMWVAYIDPEYRGKGYFKQMVEYMKTVYQAKNVKRIDFPVKLGVNFFEGDAVQTVYRTELA